jgi:Carboxypeptidase regulatory-like domain/TonB dependent receptor-like, beta-barrel
MSPLHPSSLHTAPTGYSRIPLSSEIGYLLIIGLLLLVARSLAQDASTGALRGSVADPDNQVIAGATVVVVNSATNRRYSTESNADGNYVLELLPPGNYSARAVAPGMSPQLSPPLHVDVGIATELNFRLSIAGVKEDITVSGAPPMVETQPAAVSTLIEEKAISDLPLNGRRFTDLALLAPGVTQDPRGLTSASNGDLAFGGIRGYQSSYLVDGADNNNAFFAQARGRYRAPYQFSNEVVQEFRVSSNSYGAEQGRAGGAVVNVITKSGSNHWHGTSFYFLRDSAFNAQHAYTDTKPNDRQQQFGFTFGGPVKRNKLFFFSGFDQHIFHVPTLVRFLNGETVVVPQAGTGPLSDGDYEASDQAMVFSAADQLSRLAGNFRSELLGNTGFLKLDVSLSPRNYLSTRLSTSRYWGQNNVFFDPASPITTFTTSENGEEDVTTESGNIALTSGLSPRLISHLRVQFSRDLQESYANSTAALTRIYGITDGFGRSTILPRRTREHRLHLAETLSLEGGRHSWKFGGDALLTWIYNFFPSMFGGEFYYDNIRMNPWTFEPMVQGMKITPLRAYAHRVPRYYIQNFGSATSHPDTNEYAAFLQDTIRLTHRLAVSLGVRYDLQLFSTKDLITNPLWPASGRVPNDNMKNFSPRVGLAYSVGNTRPLVIRAGYGLFYTRIPQIYTSTVATDNGLAASNLILDNFNYYDHQIFPTYPFPLVNCPLNASSCVPPASLRSFLQTDVSAFSPKFKTPRVQQASLSLEREFASRLAGGISYMYVHGVDLIRARDVNLPSPTQLTYPVYDDSGTNLLGYYNVDSFSTWQFSRSLTCPYTPCINPLARPIPQLGAINEFDSAASSVYHGLTVSVRRRMTSGLYFRLAYTFAHAVDDGQDALVAGKPATVQNSYSANSERGPSVTDQRHRLAFSWVVDPRPFDRTHEFLGRIFNDWKMSGVVTVGSGRPVDARVTGDPNQDGNTSNDRLPGVGRNSFLGPDYATTDMRISRKVYAGDRVKMELIGESFNLLNRDNQRLSITDNGFQNSAGQFVQYTKPIGLNKFPAYYQRFSNFMKPTDAYAPRQVQFALRVTF